MGTRKRIFVIAFLIIGSLLAYRFWPETAVPEPTEITSLTEPGDGEPIEFVDEPLADDLGLVDSELPEASLTDRTTQPLGETETRSIQEKLISEKAFPMNVAMDQYKSRLWQDMQDAPPALLPHNDPEIDAELAYRLYMYYGNCSVAPRTQNELDFRINQITARTQNATEEYLERVERSAERTFDFFEFCSAIPEEVDARLEAVLWMADAVYLGHPIAEAQFYEKAMGFILRPNRFGNSPPIAMQHPGIIEEFKSTSRFALRQAVERGHPEAYIAMSQAYMDDVIFPRDPVLAFAYVRVAEIEAAENRAVISKISRQKSHVTPHLTPDEIAEGNDIAHRLRLEEFGG